MPSATLGEADAKFPNQHGDGLPPPATPENPGQVYPKSDPSPAPTGNVASRSAQSLQKEAEGERRAAAREEVRVLGGRGDPQSAESGGMFTD
ncbi:hypothetical protein OF83DRAFT_1177344 [Amylostereum chailletii]|nr:hypothetical protein OF83DRAFT_1177344 [Amylostereum chailletii]